jgi:membrane protein
MASSRHSERLGDLSRSMRDHWLGRITLGSVAGFGRLDLFDRAMALAAQLFSSVLPILIMMSVWVGQSTTERFADAVSMPPAAQDVLEQALDESGGSAFGLVGAVFVLLSATSLSRALTRAMASIWRLSRPKTQLTNAWRWLAVVLAVVLAIVVTSALSRFTDPIPPRNAWTLVLTFGLDIVVAAFMPWLLLANKVPMRRLIPGGVAFALAMLVVRPASEAYLPRALEDSADQYGSIGVAFTYLASLYVVSFVLLAAAIIGNVIAEDDGRLGQFIRRGAPTRTEEPTEPVEPPESTADL